jgi:hypothetical protein
MSHVQTTDREFAELFNRKYSSRIGMRFFQVETRRETASIYICITLSNESKSFYYPVEGRMYFGDQDMNLASALDILVQYIDSYFEEYLHGDEDIYLPIDWSVYQSEGKEFQLKGQVRNLKAEQAADQLLGEGFNP